MNMRPREAVSHGSTEQAGAPSKPLSAATAAVEPNTDLPDRDPAVLDKVRELLFGEQVRETGDRIRELEERVFDETRRIHQDMTQRMERLGLDLQAKLDLLGHQVATTEGTAQANKDKTLERIAVLRDELAEQIVHSAQELDARIAENREEAIASAEQAASVLDGAKMGRETLAALLSEMASRISRD